MAFGISTTHRLNFYIISFSVFSSPPSSAFWFTHSLAPVLNSATRMLLLQHKCTLLIALLWTPSLNKSVVFTQPARIDKIQPPVTSTPIFAPTLLWQPFNSPHVSSHKPSLGRVHFSLFCSRDQFPSSSFRSLLEYHFSTVLSNHSVKSWNFIFLSPASPFS